MTVQHPEPDGSTVVDSPQATIEALQFENAAHAAAANQRISILANVREANTRLQQHLEGLGEALREEAERRGWCSEYDDFAEQWDLPKCTRGWAVTITLTVSARGEDEAIEFVKEHISLRDHTDGVVSGPEFEAEEANS